MKYGYIAFGKMKPELTVKTVAEKHEIQIKMYGFPYGVSENFVAVYASDKGLDNYQNFSMEADLPYTDTRTHQLTTP